MDCQPTTLLQIGGIKKWKCYCVGYLVETGK